MAVAIDVTGAETALGAAAASPRTYTGLTTGGSATAVTFIVTHSVQVTGSSATWDGVPCTLISSINLTGGGRVELWGLAPVAGHTGNKTFSTAWTGGGSSLSTVCGLSWTGTDTTGGTTTFTNPNSAQANNAGPAAVTITSSVGDAVLCGYVNDNNNHFNVANNTSIYVDNNPSPYCLAANRAAGAATVAMQCTLTGTAGWAVAGMNIKQPGGAAAVPAPKLTPARLGPMFSARRLFATPSPVPVDLTVISAQLAVTEATDTAAFNGQAVISAQLAVTELSDTPSFAGSVIVSGPLAVTETADIAAFAGQVVIAATLATTEAADTAAFAGWVQINGTLAVTEGTDAASFAGAGSFPTITGTLAVTEGTDTAAFNGQAVLSAALAVTEATDTASFAGQAVISAALAVTDTNDVAVFAGSVLVAGPLAVTELPDTGVFAGQVVITATLAVTELPDTASFAGQVKISAALATTEATDTASFAGVVTTGPAGSFALTEATDAAAFAGQLFNMAQLAVTEASDTAAFTGQVLIRAQLAVVEAQDTALFTSMSPILGVLQATERQDIAKFVVPTYLLPGDLNFGIPDVIVPRRW